MDEKEPGALKTDRTTVVSMESPTPGISQQPVVESPKMMSSEPLSSSRRHEDVQEATNTPEGATGEKGEVLELLAFQLADEEYALDILMIKEIIRSLEITHVPRRPSAIKGIISLRGTIIPIYDLRTRLGLTESPPARNTRILVVELNKGLIGIIADRVTEVVKVKGRDVEPPPATGDGMLSGHLKGVTRVSGRLIILLDLTKAITL
ncbi:MAG: purine-binding chemotaxis protein CheW [Nitrospirae bacterium]|nr:purine-binding chemotaxis protein CheW [Nitrospirota bacterium]